jgi:hypothetical protein
LTIWAVQGFDLAVVLAREYSGSALLNYLNPAQFAVKVVDVRGCAVAAAVAKAAGTLRLLVVIGVWTWRCEKIRRA